MEYRDQVQQDRFEPSPRPMSTREYAAHQGYAIPADRRDEKSAIKEVLYRDYTFYFDPERFTFRVQKFMVTGDLPKAIELLFGEAVFEDIADWPISTFRGIFEALTEQGGLGK